LQEVGGQHLFLSHPNASGGTGHSYNYILPSYLLVLNYSGKLVLHTPYRESKKGSSSGSSNMSLTNDGMHGYFLLSRALLLVSPAAFIYVVRYL
jgi:hypothetical protein